jgi:hypothetical protein
MAVISWLALPVRSAYVARQLVIAATFGHSSKRFETLLELPGNFENTWCSSSVGILQACWPPPVIRWYVDPRKGRVFTCSKKVRDCVPYFIRQSPLLRAQYSFTLKIDEFKDNWKLSRIADRSMTYPFLFTSHLRRLFVLRLAIAFGIVKFLRGAYDEEPCLLFRITPHCTYCTLSVL